MQLKRVINRGLSWLKKARPGAVKSVPEDARRLPLVETNELFPENKNDIRVNLLETSGSYGDMPEFELKEILQIIKRFGPRTIFEIGTFEGNTTLHLAMNSEAKVLTLDLPPKAQQDVSDPELDVYPEEPGVRFRGTPYSVNITQLYGDSRTFDFSPYFGKINFVFVDACHHYEFVKRDSQNALKMVSEQGIVIWHDYATYAPGVVRALEEIGEQRPLFRIKDTSLVLYAPQLANNSPNSELKDASFHSSV